MFLMQAELRIQTLLYICCMILVTGGTGFVGSHLAELCVKKGFEVIAFDRYNPNYNLGWLEKSKYCEIYFKPVKSLPDWEGIELYCNNASKLSCVLDPDKPWRIYQQIVTKIIGEQDFQSQLGGYPKWLQGETTPKNNEEKPMNLLFQIDSEQNAELMWGDFGLIYVFYDEETEKIVFDFQCH